MLFTGLLLFSPSEKPPPALEVNKADRRQETNDLPLFEQKYLISFYLIPFQIRRVIHLTWLLANYRLLL
jgi:hypothetical protein